MAEHDIFREPFDSVGITPPRGRQGHSVPTPRPLLGAARPHDHPNTLMKQASHFYLNNDSQAVGHSPAQFYSHREHTFGGLSKLDRLCSRTELSYLESFSEVDEEYFAKDTAELPEESENSESSQPSSKQDRKSGNFTASRNMGPRKGATLEQFRGDSLLHFSYHAGHNQANLNPDLGGSFVRAFSQGLNSSLNVPFFGQSMSSPDITSSSTLFPSAARNPNKAIITIDAHTSRILTANEMTCELFGYQRNHLENLKVQNLFTEPYRAEHRALVEQNIDSSGNTVLVSGKVMDAVTSYGVEFPVSVWMKKMKMSSPVDSSTKTPLITRVILIIEPVERSSALFTVDKNGTVVNFDPWFSSLFGYSEDSQILGKSIHEFLPSLKLPSNPNSLSEVSWKQAITGRCRDSTVFPVTVKFTDVSQNLSIGDMYSPTLNFDSSPLDQVVQQMSTTSPARVTTTEPKSEDSDRTPHHKENTPESSDNFIINAKVVVYAALSGMISFLPDGSVHGCNHHFSSMLFGYSSQELLKQDITCLIPELYSHINYVDDGGIPLPPLEEDQEDLFHSAMERSLSPERAYELVQQAGGSEATVSPSHRRGGEHVRSPARKALNLQHLSKHSPHKQLSNGQPQSPTPIASTNPTEPVLSEKLDLLVATSSEQILSSSSPDVLVTSSSNPVIDSNSDPQPQAASPQVPSRLVPSHSTERIMEMLRQHDIEATKQRDDNECLKHLSSTPTSKAAGNLISQQINSSPGIRKDSYDSMLSIASLPEGTFLGEARHKDGSILAIIFQLKCISLSDDQKVYCLWISRDLDRDRARTADLSMSMSRPPPDPYRSEQLISPDVPQGTTELECSGMVYPAHQTEEGLAMSGEYSVSYDTLKQIGKGAFGFVRLAQRKSDSFMVVVKFLRKSSVLKDCWVEDEEMGRVPLEICLLARLSHPNIVQLLEAYENEFFFQMVMVKHGDGLDLFEFIEMSPHLEEPLISYIFRQIVSGLGYLHEMKILHRDIKDENIIIDRDFHIKLIDFGSAAYMAPGKLFNTFCGTLEYCSPEVLLGNSYTGPELEMWALGVTLYTLVFRENPFLDIDETISGHLQPPFLTSPALMKVLFWLLHPDPRSRATLKDLSKDKWTNQEVDPSAYSFEQVLGLAESTLKTDTSQEHSSNLIKSNSENDAHFLHSAMQQQLLVSNPNDTSL